MLKAEAKVAEAQAVLDYLKSVQASSLFNVRDTLYWATFRLGEALKDEFVLPTEAPAKIRAKRDPQGWESDLELWTNGDETLWKCEYDGEFYIPYGVMNLFVDHRIVED